MKTLLFLLLCISFAAGDKIITVASYNVENLFDLNKDGYEYPEYIPYTVSNWNKATYKIKLENIAKVIQDIDADIIALQEVESLEALRDLRFELKQNGLYYQYYKIADKKNTNIKVALLSKIPFVYTQEISVSASYQHRNILEVKFTLYSKDFYVFINHWKAKTGPESKRILSAKALQKRIKQIGYEKNIILLGDFNSDYEEYLKFERKRAHNDTNGKTGINHVLKSINQVQKASLLTYEKENFYNLWYDTNEYERYTYIYKGNKEALDNILISQSLLNKKDMYYKESSISSFKPKYLLKGKGINKWHTSTKKPQVHKGKGFSDHLPIFAKFVVTE